MDHPSNMLENNLPLPTSNYVIRHFVLVIGIIISTFAFLFLIPSYSPTLSVNAQGEVSISDINLANNQTTETSGDHQDPPLGSDFVWRGMISSDTSILPGRENTQ